MTAEELTMIRQALRYHAQALEKLAKSRMWGGERFAESRQQFRDMAKERYELAFRLTEGSS